MFRSLKRQSRLSLLLVCVILVAGSATAGDTPASTNTEEKESKGIATEAMTAEHEAELRAFLAPRFNRSDEGLTESIDADGGVTLDLGGGFQNITLARVADGGTIEIGCFDELEAAIRFLKFESAPALPDHDTAAD